MRREALWTGALAAGVTLAGGIPRILLATGALPEALRPFTWSDPLFLYERGLSGHRLPYADTPFEYPPLVGAISALLSLASPSAGVFVAAWVALVAAAAAVCGAALAHAAGPERARWRWSLAPQLLLFGTVNFDLLPATLLALAAIALRSGRSLVSAPALALGAAAKLFPAASAPVALARSPRRVTWMLVFFAVLGLLYVPTALQPHSSASGLGLYAVGIGPNLDSIWGLAERSLSAIGIPDAPLLIVVATTAGMFVTYVALALPLGLRTRDPAVSAALATVTLLLWSRLYSPQYSLWLLPFFSLLDLSRSAFALLVIADIGVFLTIYPLTLVPRTPADTTGVVLLGLLAAFVVLRHVALVVTWRGAVRVADLGADRRAP